MGGGPSGTSVAFNVASRFPDKDVTLFFSGDDVLPGYHPKTRAYHMAKLREAGVTLKPGHRADPSTDGVRTALKGGTVGFSSGQPDYSARCADMGDRRRTSQHGISAPGHARRGGIYKDREDDDSRRLLKRLCHRRCGGNRSPQKFSEKLGIPYRLQKYKCLDPGEGSSASIPAAKQSLGVGIGSAIKRFDSASTKRRPSSIAGVVCPPYSLALDCHSGDLWRH